MLDWPSFDITVERAWCYTHWLHRECGRTEKGSPAILMIDVGVWLTELLRGPTIATTEMA
jgi:hypothetical protein